MPADEEAAIRRTAAWAVRRLRAKKLHLSIRTLEPRESRLWLGELYESVKTDLFIWSEEDEADEPRDEPWQVLSFSYSKNLDPLSGSRGYHSVFSLTMSGGVLLVRRRDGKLENISWIRPERSGEGCILELIVESDCSRATPERYLVMFGGKVDDGESMKRHIRYVCRPPCGMPWTWAGRVELDDATVVPELLRTFPGFRRLTLNVPDS